MKKTIYILITISVALLMFAGGVFVSYIKYSKELKESKQQIKELKTKIEKLEKMLSEKNSILEKHSLPSEALDYACSTLKETPSLEKIVPPIKSLTVNNKKPQLVIIIDDMAFKYETELLKSIPFKITPSFFPPTKIHPNTIKYAKEFSHYMVHLPMEAMHFNRPEDDTLKTTDSYQRIATKIEEIKAQFPNAVFINNHTGSKFTSNKEAMDKLFKALKDNNMSFVDSKTTSKTQSQRVNKKYNISLYQRDIFLDNERSSNYIISQLKKAVQKAKEKGYAIAIGHPYRITLETLKNAADILKDVEVVYIDELKPN